jgi:hypothetical protein
MTARVWRWGIKGGALSGRGRVYPIRTPPRSTATPVIDPLALLLVSVNGSIVAGSSTPPLAPPLGVLLRHRIVPASSLSSASLPFFHHRRVPRPRRMTFVGWGDEAGKPPEHPVAARTQQIWWCTGAQRVGFGRWKHRRWHG